MKKTALLIFLIYLLTVLGCTATQEQKLIGKWVCKQSGDSIHLSANHLCTLNSMGLNYSGRWTLSKSEIRIEAGPIVLKGSFDDKKITAEDGVMHNIYVFEKVIEPKS